MQKTTIENLVKTFGDGILSAHARARHPLWDTLDAIEPGEAIIFEPDEWTLTARPSQMMNRHYRKDGRRFRTKRLPDGKIVIARVS